MKKIKTLPLVLLAGILMAGCTKEYVTFASQTVSYEYTIVPAQWERNQGANNPGGENYLYATFNNSDITPDVMQNGMVSADVFLIYDSQHNYGAWNPLPYVYPLELNTGTIVPENIRFEWEQGRVTFIIQDLDGYDPEDMVSTIQVRVNVTGNLH